MSNELAGKVAVVTGGASGIGLGTAETFLAEGARVVIADVNQEQGAKVVAELGAGAVFKQTDVADAAQVQALVDFAVETFGGLDIMFNNAGISGKRVPHLFDEDFADFERVTAINLLGVMLGTQIAGRYMAEHGGGSIINVTSIGGIQSAPGIPAYHTSKAGVIMFTKSAALDLGPLGVRVNAIAPSNIETPILGQNLAAGRSEEEVAEMMTKVREFLINRQAIRRQGKPSDIGQAAVFLGGDRSTYITGVVLPVDGGQLAGQPSDPKGGFAAIHQKQ